MRVYKVFGPANFCAADVREVIDELLKLNAGDRAVLTVQCIEMDAEEFAALEDWDEADD